MLPVIRSCARTTALAELNEKFRGGNKSVLTDVVTNDLVCPLEVTREGTSCLVIHVQALVSIWETF